MRRLAARLAQSLIVVVIVTTISFFVIHAAPGDPFAYDGANITQAVRDHWRHQFGYDRPLVEQYARYVTSVLHGQLGYSFQYGEPVADAIAQAVPRTLLLAGLSLGLSFLIGVVAGVLQAKHRGGWFDRVSSSVLLVFYSLPDFWLALAALMLFAYMWRVLPPGNIVDPVLHDYMTGWPALADRLRHMILPVGSLTLLTTAAIARYQRAAMLDVLPADYIRTARAKGVPESGVVWRHALRTALTPLVTMLGILFPAILGGALFVERVFSWPGMGSLAANAIGARDYDLVTATVITGSIMVVIGNVLADVLQMILDPRVRE